MKRLIALLLCFLLFTLTVSAATPSDCDQVIELTANGEALSFVATKPTTYWESPALRVGETIVKTGTLTLVNGTDVSRNIYFDYVKFPYQDKQALQYLNHLFITITDGTAVLYDGAYSCINNNDVKPTLAVALEPYASRTYTISLRCDYTYADNHYLNSEILEWIFDVEAEPKSDFSPNEEEKEKSSPIFDPLFVQWPIAAIISIIIFAAILRFKEQ